MLQTGINLKHLSRPQKDLGKQWKPISDVAKRNASSGSVLFVEIRGAFVCEF